MTSKVTNYMLPHLNGFGKTGDKMVIDNGAAIGSRWYLYKADADEIGFVVPNEDANAGLRIETEKANNTRLTGISFRNNSAVDGNWEPKIEMFSLGSSGRNCRLVHFIDTDSGTNEVLNQIFSNDDNSEVVSVSIV